jgi:hypothetical protein
MALLKQDVTSSLRDIPEQSRQGVFDTYDSIGQDLHSLLEDWQSGRQDLIRLLQPPHPQTPDVDESVADSGLGVSVAETDRKRDSCGDWGPAFAAASPSIGGELEDIFEEAIEEKVVEGTAMGRTILGRAERIEKARREREEAGERRRLIEEQGRWVGELKDVISRRRR